VVNASVAEGEGETKKHEAGVERGDWGRRAGKLVQGWKKTFLSVREKREIGSSKRPLPAFTIMTEGGKYGVKEGHEKK